MIKELIKLATHLDNKGFHKEANYLDVVIKRTAGSQEFAELSGEQSDNDWDGVPTRTATEARGAFDSIMPPGHAALFGRLPERQLQALADLSEDQVQLVTALVIIAHTNPAPSSEMWTDVPWGKGQPIDNSLLGIPKRQPEKE